MREGYRAIGQRMQTPMTRSAGDSLAGARLRPRVDWSYEVCERHDNCIDVRGCISAQLVCLPAAAAVTLRKGCSIDCLLKQPRVYCNDLEHHLAHSALPYHSGDKGALSHTKWLVLSS